MDKAHNLIHKSYPKYYLILGYDARFSQKIFNEIQIKKNNFLIRLTNLSPIFIIGLPRSGSTLVRSLLSQNNEIFYSYGIGNNRLFNT